jgi:hypothetical protein
MKLKHFARTNQQAATAERGKRDIGLNADRKKCVVSTERTCAKRIT